MPISALESNKSYHKLFHSYCVLPSTTFENQHNDEKILLLLRAHPITFVPWLFWSGLGLIAPIAFNVILLNFLAPIQVIFVNIFWFSCLFSYVFINILVWLFNVGIITNERVIDVDYHMVIHKVTTGTSIEDITDVTSRTTGFIRSYFDFGDVYVQTAGREQNLEFLRVPSPTESASIINRLMR